MLIAFSIALGHSYHHIQESVIQEGFLAGSMGIITYRVMYTKHHAHWLRVSILIHIQLLFLTIFKLPDSLLKLHIEADITDMWQWLPYLPRNFHVHYNNTWWSFPECALFWHFLLQCDTLLLSPNCSPALSPSYTAFKQRFQHTLCRCGPLSPPLGNPTWETPCCQDWSACGQEVAAKSLQEFSSTKVRQRRKTK